VDALPELRPQMVTSAEADAAKSAETISRKRMRKRLPSL
jgi:hypothetical protein